VLTGERWPTADEDALREVGNAWGTAGDRLENELGPYMVQAAHPGELHREVGDQVRRHDGALCRLPRYAPEAAAHFRQLKKFPLDASAQVEYVKIISIEELVLLIAQIA
jgi:hypothetical protein